MPGKHWSEKEHQMFVEMAGCGYKSFEIAEELGRSPDAIRARGRQYRVKIGGGRGGDPDPDKRSLLLRFLCDNPGVTLSAAARSLRWTRQCLGLMARRLAEEGLLVRSGGKTSGVRYSVAPSWGSNRAGPRKGSVRERREQSKEREKGKNAGPLPNDALGAV